MPRRFLPPLLLLITALCWSLGGALIKSIDWPPMAIAGGRSAIAVPVILLCIGRPRLTFSRAQIGGALGYAATVILFVFATRMTTAANAIFLQYTAPIYVALIGRWYLNERASRIDWLVSRTSADGARLVARAWVDPPFKQRLLADARAAALELGLDAGPSPVVVALENTEAVHHMVVCTLCSCYPKALLGPPPDWYKSLPYRSRAVSDPRGVLTEFGTELDDDVELRVVDSTADVRYLVVPRRPNGSEGMTEDELAALVTRDSMIGVAQPASPAPTLT